MRLCKAVKGAEFLSAAIEAPYVRLSSTLADKNKAVETEDAAPRRNRTENLLVIDSRRHKAKKKCSSAFRVDEMHQESILLHFAAAQDGRPRFRSRCAAAQRHGERFCTRFAGAEAVEAAALEVNVSENAHESDG